jgi:hypothetical protein
MNTSQQASQGTQYGIYIGLLCVSLFVAACWVLVCILLTPLGGDPDVQRVTMYIRLYLIAFGSTLVAIVTGVGCWVIARRQDTGP